ncbi:hypothetical protein DOTSEDRAFT_55678 [Dothistroma septosporum NZE10]|uniref:Uncharacterized protein n=1 Tax=Dothistroma septosporum (strain NZE10 / CBS 128990) TaxID=675120 RepID=N1PEC2_DOTSN|nr:hypothetical protein DOTSEDRAFT_55678 [Dothistroma septosporum NZE10]
MARTKNYEDAIGRKHKNMPRRQEVTQRCVGSPLKNPDDQRDSRLMGSTAELRNKIWEHVFQDSVVKLRDRRKNYIELCLNAPGLLVSCKQVYPEAVGIYYTNTAFKVWYTAKRLRCKTACTPTRLPEFLHGIGKEKASLIRNIYLNDRRDDWRTDTPRELIISRSQSAAWTLHQGMLEVQQAYGITVAPGVLKGRLVTCEGEDLWTSRPGKAKDELLAKLAEKCQA